MADALYPKMMCHHTLSDLQKCSILRDTDMLLLVQLALPLRLNSSSSSACIWASILAPLEGSFPCALACGILAVASDVSPEAM